MMEDFTKKYNYLIIDSVNFAYRTFKTKDEIPLQISKKSVYRESICRFINAIEELKNKYLYSDGEIYLLFDNYYSKADLRSTYMFADRRKLDESYKATRKKENKEFYNSINFLRYYYLIGPKDYHTIRIDNLEADDLVEPLLMKLNLFKNENKSALMITNDLDWTRYLKVNIDWLPDLSTNPENFNELSKKLGIQVNTKNILLYKSIFGDKSDNITGLVTLNEKNLEDFNNLAKIIEYPEQIITLSRDDELTDNSLILKTIAINEKAFLINLQLVSSIPCSVDMLNCSLTTGREATTLYETIKEAIGLKEPQGFVFGNIKRNRVS